MELLYTMYKKTPKKTPTKNCDLNDIVHDNKSVNIEINNHKSDMSENIINANNKTVKEKVKYICESCDFKTKNKRDYSKHLLTIKHMSVLIVEPNQPKNYTCICNRVYTCRQGLYSHKKKCEVINDINQANEEMIATKLAVDQNMLAIIQENSSFKKLILDLVNKKNEENNDLPNSNELQNIIIDLQKQNNDLQKQVLEVCKNIQPGINNSTNNSNNKTFNLNFFLNEQCKDAMNLSEFVNSFHLKMEDLERVGELGYVEGIGKLLVNKLNDLDVYKRPMHCSDAKRETLYVKDKDKWEKEQSDNPKIRKAIKKVSSQNMLLLNQWRDTHPGSRLSTSEVNTQFISLVKQANGGNDDIVDSEDKIIRRIAREIVIAK